MSRQETKNLGQLQEKFAVKSQTALEPLHQYQTIKPPCCCPHSLGQQCGWEESIRGEQSGGGLTKLASNIETGLMDTHKSLGKAILPFIMALGQTINLMKGKLLFVRQINMNLNIFVSISFLFHFWLHQELKEYQTATVYVFLSLQ